MSNRRFNAINYLRPANAVFGEVVCIELYVEEKYLAYSKMKGIHRPASSNAYWNWMNLRSSVTENAKSLGVSSHGKRAISSLLEKTVAWIHENELRAYYHDEGESVQYYTVYINSFNQGSREWSEDGERTYFASVKRTDKRDNSHDLCVVL